MTDPTPIACTLTPHEMATRAAEVSALGRAALRAIEPGERMVTLRFDPSVRAELERIVAAESRCCPFLDFRLDRDATLTITSPLGGELVLAELADLFAHDTDVKPSRPWSPSP